ncbi:MAG TPA: BTAD domain-containing putative transcriptional regulator [Ktedonobacteraceae bacterium]|nr:BTAD domain-containing putative transcriptional regulator [Ktedonobacteraceae bacterium]
MQDANIFRKITTPALPPIFLHRAKLVSAFRDAIASETWKNASRSTNKLVLLCAPAGYGKTTLLADVAAAESIRCCWYFLEKADNDVVVFLQTLLASLRQAFPTFGQPLTGLMNLFGRETPSPTGMYRTIVDTLCSAIATAISERFALCLCNYEAINENEMLTDLVDYLLARLPPQAVLVIESRAFPRFELTPLIVHSAMFVLNQESLRFSAEEILALAGLHGLTTLTHADAEQLTRSFDGWITGILLGTYLGDFRILPRGQNTPLLRTNDPRQHNLLVYAINEVFQRDPVIYDFLQPASILQHMEAEMCNSLLGIHNAASLLTRLEQQGFFVTSSESAAGETIYTCHPVIRNLLTTQLSQHAPDRFSTLHHQAAELWLAKQNYDQAMHHALEAETYDLAARLIIDTHKNFLRQGRVDTLVLWLDALPPAIRESTPRLLLVEATIAITRGQYTSTLPILDRVSALIASQPTSEHPAETRRLQAEAHILRAQVLSHIGENPQALALCQQVLSELAPTDVELRAALTMRIGICANVLGDFSSGILHLQEALRYWDTQISVHQALTIHGVLVNAYYMTGNFTLADYHLTRSLNYCEELQDEQGKIDNLLRKGIIAKDMGRYPEAETTLQEARRLAHNSILSRHREAYALVNLGDLSLDQGNYLQALAFSEDALALASRAEDSHLVRIILLNISLAHLLIGDLASTQLFLDQADVQDANEDQPAPEKTWRDLTYSLLLLYQHRSDEAHACLTRLENALRTTHTQREHVQAQLRLAACQLLRKQEGEMQHLLADVTSTLAQHGHYKQLVLVELQWLPDLLQAIKRQPYLARLRELLGLASDLPLQVEERDASEVTAYSRPPLLSIRAFGEPVVLLDTQPIKHWRMARGMELFFFLLDADYPQSKESIITEIWQDVDEQTNQTFHSTLHYLRKLFGTSSLVLDAEGYHLNLGYYYGERVWYDVQTFRAYHAEAEQALSHASYSAARSALLQMVKLYRGDYGRPFYSNWCTFRRDELRTLYLNARRHLAQLAWRSETFEECIDHWQSMLQVDTCLEEAHLGLMQCYDRQGNRSAALRQYQQCKETLQQELGIEVSSPIQLFYQRLSTS